MVWQKIRKNGEPAKKPGRKPGENYKPKKLPTFVKGVERPHVWKCGPDKEKHDMYTPWMRSKAQANFREEPWTLTFEEYYDIWKDNWHHRGRHIDDLCMSRKDPNGAWSLDNCVLISRHEHLKNQAAMRKAIGMKYNKTRSNSNGSVKYHKLKKDQYGK